MGAFYSQGGWQQFENTTLVGGTKETPFRSDLFDKVTMIQFLSEKAQNNQQSFINTDILIEIEENKRW